MATNADLKGPWRLPSAERSQPTRREERSALVRHVEYTPFPRVSAHRRGRLAFTRDISASGLCLRCEAPEAVGSLLRVAVRGVDGSQARVAIARVVWTRPTVDGAHWVGLAIVADCARRVLRAPRAATRLIDRRSA